MAQDKQVDILGSFTAASQGDQAKETLGQHVDDRQQHGVILPEGLVRV
jgi:hypothetical protein